MCVCVSCLCQAAVPGMSVKDARTKIAGMAGSVYEEDAGFLQWVQTRSVVGAPPCPCCEYIATLPELWCIYVDTPLIPAIVCLYVCRCAAAT